MPRFEYKVVPAPTKGLKARGVRGAEARFSNAIETLMNELAAEGWEYQRAETLPSTERAGLTSTTTEWRNLLVFRRPHSADAEAFSPELLPPPMPVEAAPTKAQDEAPAPKVEQPAKKEPALTAAEELVAQDHGAENAPADAAEGPSATLTTLAAHRKKATTDD